MDIEQAKYEAGWLCLKTQPSDALKWCFRFKPGNYEIKRVRQKRSIDANSLCWVLLDKLSAALGVPKEELYQRYIKEIGGVSDILCVPNKAVEKFRAEWENKGIGWQTETIPLFSHSARNFSTALFGTQRMSETPPISLMYL